MSSERAASRLGDSTNTLPSANAAGSEPSRAGSSRALTLAFAAYFAGYLVFWAAEALILGEEPHGDDLEQLLWAAHPALGYSKHPPLPSLLLFAVEQLIPAGIPLVYAMGAACVAVTLLFAWKVGKATLAPALAVIAVLAATTITFHTQRLNIYNNNTGILVANAAAMLCVWRAVTSNRRHWWIALGVAWGCGMLSKYQMALVILCNVAFVAVSRDEPVSSRVSGLTIAALVAAALFAPHVVWLIQNDFPTFHYASTEVLARLPLTGRLRDIASFFADEVWRTVPAIVLLRIMYTAAGAKRKRPSQVTARTDARVRQFWLIHAWGPMAAMFLVAAFGGVALQMHWGTAFLWAMPFWFLTTDLGSRLDVLSPARALGCAAGVQAALVLIKLLLPQY